MYYFKYQHKVQMIPCIQQQISQYLATLSRQLHLMSTEQKIKIHKQLLRKHKKIQQFYDKCYVDFRGGLILRSYKLIAEFLNKYAEQFPKELEEKLNQMEHKRFKKQEQESKRQNEKVNQISKEKVPQQINKNSYEPKNNLLARASLQVERPTNLYHITQKPKNSKISNAYSNSSLNKSLKTMGFSSSNQKQKQIGKQKQKEKDKQVQMRIYQSNSSLSLRKDQLSKVSPVTNRNKVNTIAYKKLVKSQVTQKMTKNQYINYLKNKQKQ